MVGLLAVLLVTTSALAQDDKTLIVPKLPAEEQLPPMTDATPGSSSIWLVAGVLALGGALVYLWRNTRLASGINRRTARKLNISETCSLGNRQYLVVVDYEGSKHLLGVCPGKIRHLTHLQQTNRSEQP